MDTFSCKTFYLQDNCVCMYELLKKLTLSNTDNPHLRFCPPFTFLSDVTYTDVIFSLLLTSLSDQRTSKDHLYSDTLTTRDVAGPGCDMICQYRHNRNNPYMDENNLGYLTDVLT